MESTIMDVIFNNGVAVGVIVWFMFKNNKDMDTFKTAITEENKLTRDTLNELKIVIATLGGQKSE